MGILGQRILRMASVDSTNAWIMAREDALNQAGLVVWAEHQTAGKGQKGRQFASVAGQQLLFSVVAHPTCAPEEISLVSLLAGLAVAQAIDHHTGLSPQLKWPNDVVVAERKVCGVLVEMKSSPQGQPRLVIGIGINCYGQLEDYPEELRGVLTTLEAQGVRVDREALLKTILERLDGHLFDLTQGEKARLLEDWRKRAWLKGRRVKVWHGATQAYHEAIAHDITVDGQLMVTTPGGQILLVLSGDVEWLA